MRKKILLLSLLAVISCSLPHKEVRTISKAQISPTKKLLFVKYEVISTVFEEPSKLVVMSLGELYADDVESLFRWNYDTDEKIDIPEGSNYVTFPPGMMDKTGNVIQINYLEKTLTQRENLYGSYLLTKERVPKFNWKITGKKGKTSGMPAFQAKCSFRGRDYIAWFTPKIPVNSGPWKFSGLPGLILDVYDNQNKFRFRAKTIEYPFDGPIQMISFSKEEQLDWEEFTTIGEKLKDKIRRKNLATSKDNNGVMTVEVFEQVRQELFDTLSYH